MSSSPHQVPRCQANRPLALLVVRTYVMYLHIDNTNYSDQRVGVPDR
ncbi:hypothetical protein [Amycolatopsis sp. lyj-346]